MRSPGKLKDALNKQLCDPEQTERRNCTNEQISIDNIALKWYKQILPDFV